MKKTMIVCFMLIFIWVGDLQMKVHAVDFEFDDVGKKSIDLGDENNYEIYSSAGTMVFEDDVLKSSTNTTEIKTLIKNDTNQIELDFNVTIKSESSNGSMNAGVYVLSKNYSNQVDRVDALNIQIERNSNQRATVSLFDFSSTSGYLGRLKVADESFDVIENAVYLRILIKDQTLYVFVQYENEPILTYDIPTHKYVVGDIGFRSQYSDISFSQLEVMEVGISKYVDHLETQVQRANLLESEDYEISGFTQLMDKLDRASDILNQVDSYSQYEIDAVTGDIIKAIYKLELRPTFESLQALILEIDAIDNNKYEQASLSLLESALSYAKTSKFNDDREQIETYYIALKTAFDNLKYKHYLKLFAVVSSFGVDSLTYLHQFAENIGIYMDIHYLYLGGGTLQQHSQNIKNDSAVYLHHHNGFEVKSNVRISEIIELETWDYIIFQQSAAQNGILDSYYPYVYDLIHYFTDHSPQAELIINQLWAYHSQSTEAVFVNTFNRDPEYMWTSIESAVNDVVEKTGIRYLTPSGHAMQLARKMQIEGRYENLYRDGFHANEIGRYLLAATWLQFITGLDVRENNYMSSGYSYNDSVGRPTAETMTILKQVAYDVNQLYETMDLYVDVNIPNKVLIGIEIVSEPNKKTYTEAMYLNLEGLVVHAVYDDGTSIPIDTFNVDLNRPLKTGDDKLTISYMGYEKEVTIKVNVLVNEIHDPIDAEKEDLEKTDSYNKTIFTINLILSISLLGAIGFVVTKIFKK